MSIRVLVAEDEPKVQKFIKSGLEQSGMTTDCVDTLEGIESSLSTQSYDVLILDRLLKTQDSLYSIPRLRKLKSPPKILVLSALSEVEDRVSGLDYGADDYLAKPFHVSELVARIRTLARRADTTKEESRDSILKIGDLQIRLDTQEVNRSETQIHLTAKEFKILTLLARHPQKIFSKSELLDRIWGINFDPESNVVEVAMTRLRSKMNPEDFKPLIHTKRGGGYWLGTGTPSDSES
jgi:DNA-binding response OmpR family regulator